MIRFSVTEQNWRDFAFWSAVHSGPDESALDFSALGAEFSVSFTLAKSNGEPVLVLSDGGSTFLVGSAGMEGVDATLAGTGGIADFAAIEVSDSGAQIVDLPADLVLEEMGANPDGATEAAGDTETAAEPPLAEAKAEASESDPLAASIPAPAPSPQSPQATATTDIAPAEAALDVTAEIAAESGGAQVVVIDASLEDAATLAASFGPEVQVILLDPGSDGLSQIAAALEGQSDIAALHILAHGDAGHLQLGSTLLNQQAIEGPSADLLSEIGATLSETGDILIYGCNFGAGAEGEAAMAALAEATMGDIAASDDLTGAEDLGGDWELEVSLGAIESEAYELSQWDHVMSNWYGTGGDDSLIDYYGSYGSVYGYGGSDTLYIGYGTIYAGDGNDSIGVNFSGSSYGQGGDDVIWGFGNTVVDGGTGTDTLITVNTAYDITIDLNVTSSQLVGNGQYTQILNIENITTGGGDDALRGDAGANVFHTGTGADTIYGESGDDSLDGGTGADSLYGGAGDDTFAVSDGFGSDVIYGQSGSGDHLDASALTSGATVTFTDGEDGTLTDGTDTLSFDNIEEFTLTSQADSVNGSLANEGMYIDAGAGDDTITGGAGDDSLLGGAGNDSLVAGNNSGAGDTLEGGSGADTLVDSYWNATLSGGDDADLIKLGYGNATVTGGEGGTDADTISFMDANDAVDITLSGPEAGSYTDSDGDAGTFSEIEAFILSDQADTFSSNGVTGAESVYGMGGDDSIETGAGDDLLEGGTGADTLTGGAGEDVFRTTAGDGRDTITDFDIADDDSNGFFNDQLDVSSLLGGTGPLGSVRGQDVVVSDDGSGNAVLTFPNGEELLLTGVAPSAISGAANLYSAGIPCFTPAVRIATARGLVPAAEIRLGDLLQTADNGLQPVIWRGERRLDQAALCRQPELKPILLQPGSLLGNETGILVSPQHRFVLPRPLSEEEAFLRAKLLCDLPLSRIRQARGTRNVRYIHLMTPRHEVVFAEGIATETFWPGAQALRSLEPPQRHEILSLFPDLPLDQGQTTRRMAALARQDLRRSDLRRSGLLPA